MKPLHRSRLALAALAALGLHALDARAQLVINDTLTGASSSYNWKSLNGACLTAGNNTGTIPACSGLAYYSGKTLVGGTSGRLPDSVGQGALRLTNGDTQSGGSNGDYQTGAVVSNFTFPTNQGIQVTWTSVTYGGDALNGTGADGISFFLSDGGTTANPVAPSVGGQGGSLGYSCANTNGVYDGVIGGYIGIGIDEYGNFSNKSDNTDTGDAIAGLHPKRISVRGAGSTATTALMTNYPAYYGGMTSGNYATALHNTCKTGYLWNYTGATMTDSTGQRITTGNQTHDRLAYNYPLISTSDLPSNVSLANQEGTNMPVRGSAIPITYALKITSDGTMDFSYSVNGGSAQNVITGASITASNGPLPSSFRFGFSSGTGGGNNVHEITCFKAAQASQSESSAGSNVQSGRADTNTQVYLAFYHPQNWWGSLTANSLTFDATTNTLGVNTIATWDAGCVLTGGSCQSTNSSVATAQASANRTILSAQMGGSATNASTPISFEWNQLSTAQVSALTAGDSSQTADRFNYLRGNRTKEVSAGGAFRNRTSVLGDIVDSSPAWVGPPSSPYTGPWVDKLRNTVTPPEGTTYTTFSTGSAATRTNVVYVGANDGMLHGFRAGTMTNGVLGGTNDGYELLSYVPAQVVASIHSINGSLDFAGTPYSHNFYADATPGSGDLYYAGAWHTWVVSGLGPGGHTNGPVGDNVTVPTAAPVGTIFALDVTNPANFSESTPSATVIGEWSSTTISCTNFTGCGTHLGQVTGSPLIRRLHDGNWAVLFGNGLNSASGTAGLFIMEIDSTSGARTFRYIDTGAGSTTNLNGIANVTAADLDGDHVTDYVYAGDLLGNVWRFDLTGAAASSWSVGSTPVFTTPTGQPITARVTVASVAAPSSTGLPKVLISWGTGQKQPQTLITAETFATGTQYLYGVWDWNMAAWNATTTDTKYDSLTAPQTVSATNLVTQTVTSTLAGNSTVSGYRTVSTTAVCWKNSSACSSGNTQFGWRLALPSTQEQVVYNPTTSYGMFIVNTTIPSVSNALSCQSTPASGYTMAITLQNGGAATTAPFFADSSGGFTTANIAGVGTNGTGTPAMITYMNPTTGIAHAYAVMQTANGQGTAPIVNPSGGTGSRVNWTKLR